MLPTLRHRRRLTQILSFLIAGAVSFNVCLFLRDPPPPPSPSPPSAIRPIPRYLESEPFTDTELNEAISFLDLPIWSRGHLNCSNAKSEVTCGQIVHASRTIRNWLELIDSIPFEDRHWVLCHQVFDGIGNRMSIDTFLFILSLMGNRSLAVTGWHMRDGVTDKSRGNAYEYHRSMTLYNESMKPVLYKASHWWVPMFQELFVLDWAEMLSRPRLIELEGLIYASMLYAIPEMHDFCIRHFGMHALYFVANFLIKIPRKHLEAAASIVDAVPRNVFVMGVHLRLQFPGQFYSHSVVQTIKVVRPFVQEILARRPTLIAFASDSPFMERDFMSLFARHVIVTKAVRKADFDHESALVDMAFLEMCDDLLLSYRSTFSFSVSMRRGRPCFWVEKEATGVFQLSHSQVGAVSMLMHAWDVNDWQTSRRYVVGDKDEAAFRFDFKYFRL
jgi:hypothetical protein